MQLLAVSKNAFLESIRQPIYPVLLLLGSLLLVLNPPLCGYTFDDDNKLLYDIGLSIILMLGMMLAAFTATGVVSQEIENKTVLTVVSKPISRWLFIVGKFLGVAAAITAAAYIWSIIFLFTARHGVMSAASQRFDFPVIVLGTLAGGVALLAAAFSNYAYRKPFGGTLTLWLMGTLSVAAFLLMFITKQWQIAWPLRTNTRDMWQVVMALALLIQALWLICAIATAMSTRFGQVPTLIACLVIVFAGLSSAYFLGEAAKTSVLALVVYRALPNMQYFWMSDALTQGHSASGEYYLNVTLYALCFIIASLGLAVALFETRETS